MEEIGINGAEVMEPQEIADDVQQTFDGVSNEYRSLLQGRIEWLLEQTMLRVNSDVKRIMSHNFGKERNKQRLTDPEKNKELTSLLGSAFTVIETEVKDDLKRYLIGKEPIFNIVPKRDYETDETKA